MAGKVWLITGASRGLGRHFATAALGRGDRVAAISRRLRDLDDLSAQFGDQLLMLEVDVTDRAADFEAVERAIDRFGRLDVVVNNAGYGHFGAFEELSESDLRDQFETNVYGAVWITQAALPHMRDQGGGLIVQISSGAGIFASPRLSAYCGSKWALEAMSESLAAEVAAQGIEVLIVEPGAYETDWSGPSARSSRSLEQYDELREKTARQLDAVSAGEPSAAGRALLEIVDAENRPLRVIFGAGLIDQARRVYQQRIQEWSDWQDLALRAHGGGQ